MKLAGLIRTSLLDDPGYICCVAFTSGCDLRCPYCHNGDLVEGAVDGEGFPLERLWDHLEARRGRLDGVAFTGGEPTLQPDLAEVLAEARVRGFRVKLDTNGTRPGVLEELLGRRLVDRVALDVKLPLER
ncbi:MAG: anaerobic ribonucleoside-triphosphate reductase activating protein, partial [Synergistales bacterium]|nr:anaerobic ribonucleoside-triphosphate reductase activating protein [Synergistales bacterium]